MSSASPLLSSPRQTCRRHRGASHLGKQSLSRLGPLSKPAEIYPPRQTCRRHRALGVTRGRRFVGITGTWAYWAHSHSGLPSVVLAPSTGRSPVGDSLRPELVHVADVSSASRLGASRQTCRRHRGCAPRGSLRKLSKNKTNRPPPTQKQVVTSSTYDRRSDIFCHSNRRKSLRPSS